jgi:outer membrane immunogenic protein
MKWLAFAASILALSTVAATAADLAAAPYAKAPVAPPIVDSWTGFYLGGSVGARRTDADVALTTIDEVFIGGVQPDLPACTTPGNTPPCPTKSSFGSWGARIGAHVGYNLQLGSNWLIGAEVDGAWANTSTTSGAFKYFQGIGAPDSTIAVKTTWDATARARLGFLPRPDLLVYATGGAAWTQSQLTSNCGAVSCFPGTFAPSALTSTVNWAGWTIGGGVEAKLDRNWIVRGEYRYADFGTKHITDVRTCSPSPSPSCGIFTNLNVGYDLSLKTQTVLFGISYLFL